MRQLLSLIIGLVVFATGGLGATVLYQTVHYGYWMALLLLGVSALVAGYLAGYNARDAFSGLLGGLIVTGFLWFQDTSSAWASVVFKAPLTSLNSDEVLLGLSLTLFAFLQGARWGEAVGLYRLRRDLLASSGTDVVMGAPAGGMFGFPPPEAIHSHPPELSEESGPDEM